MNDLTAEITRLRAREQFLLEANNAELERRRDAERQAVSFEVMAKAMLAEAGRPYRLQIRAADWVRTRIGAEYMATSERAMRLLEEAVELAQAEGITAEQIARQVEHVYGRKAGDPTQEMGGVLVCAMAWCAAAHVDLVDVAQKEVERIEAKPLTEIRGSLARKADADLVVVVGRGGADEIKTCECPTRAALERLKGAGDRTVLDGVVILSAPFMDSLSAALSAPCPCAELREEHTAMHCSLRRVINQFPGSFAAPGASAAFVCHAPDELRLRLAEKDRERDSLRAELATAKADADRWKQAHDGILAEAARMTGEVNAELSASQERERVLREARSEGPCGHAWDRSIHRACPRCAIASVESVLRGMHERLVRIYSESCVIGYDSGNTVVAALAREAIDLWQKAATPEGTVRS